MFAIDQVVRKILDDLLTMRVIKTKSKRLNKNTIRCF